PKRLEFRRLLFPLTKPYNESFSWTYLDNGWLWTQRNSNAVVATCTYNALGQTTDLNNSKTNGTMLPHSGCLVYDGAGKRASLTANLPGVSSYSGQTTYQYDVKDQVTQEASTRTGGYTSNFEYDNAGNPTNFKGVAQTFNAANQNTANVFDLNGNPTTYKGTS